MTLTNLIVHETAPVDAGDPTDMAGLEPDTLNTPGNTYEQFGAFAVCDRDNGVINVGWVGLDVGETDQRVTCTVNCNSGSSAGNEFYIYVRVGSSASTNIDGYAVRVSPNRALTARIVKFSTGSESTLDSSSTSLSNSVDITVDIEIVGTSLTAVVDDGTSTINLSATDSTHSTGNLIGVRPVASPGTADEVKVYNTAGSGHPLYYYRMMQS